MGCDYYPRESYEDKFNREAKRFQNDLADALRKVGGIPGFESMNELSSKVINMKTEDIPKLYNVFRIILETVHNHY